MSFDALDRIGIGPTEKLILRVSVAVLVRLLFRHPVDGVWTLALERKATLVESDPGGRVEVRAQPFGGAGRIVDLQRLHDLLINFHFDSERSRNERDFRLFIEPGHWQALKTFCIEHFMQGDTRVVDTSPGRELSEEIADALHIQISPSSYTSRAAGIVLEDLPRATENPRAKGYATVRLYQVYEVILTDPYLRNAMIKNDKNFSDMDLEEIVITDAQQGVQARPTAFLPHRWRSLQLFTETCGLKRAISRCYIKVIRWLKACLSFWMESLYPNTRDDSHLLGLLVGLSKLTNAVPFTNQVCA